jgi:hypothetical protein
VVRAGIEQRADLRQRRILEQGRLSGEHRTQSLVDRVDGGGNPAFAIGQALQLGGAQPADRTAADTLGARHLGLPSGGDQRPVDPVQVPHLVHREVHRRPGCVVHRLLVRRGVRTGVAVVSERAVDRQVLDAQRVLDLSELVELRDELLGRHRFRCHSTSVVTASAAMRSSFAGVPAMIR